MTVALPILLMSYPNEEWCLQISAAAKLKKWSAQLKFKQNRPFNLGEEAFVHVCVSATTASVLISYVSQCGVCARVCGCVCVFQYGAMHQC